MPINVNDLVAAQRAYAQARLQAIQDVSRADPAQAAAARRQQQQAMLQYLHARIKLLTDARSRALEQFDAQIAQYQQRIGELRQIIKESSSAPSPAPPAPTPAKDNPQH